MNLKRAIETGLLLGSGWGLVEVVLTFVTGFAPASDAVEVMLAPVLVLVLYQLTVLAASQVRPHPVFDLLDTAGVLLPTLVLFLRGRGQRAPVHLLAGLAPIILGAFLVFLERRRRSNRGWLKPMAVASILLLYFGAALAFAIRTDRVSAVTSALIATACFWCVSAAAIAALAAAAPGRFRGGAVPLVLFGAAFGVAWQRGSDPPRYRGEMAPPSAGRPAAPIDAPNLLLIVLDTVRADHLDLYGYSRPTFALTSKYLRDGLVFDSATSSGTFSLPSHASLFTGRLPSAHGARSVIGGDTAYGRVWPELETIASFLGARGYRTAGVSANDIFLAEWTGLQKGFDTFSASAPRALRFNPLSTAFRRSMSRATRARRRLSTNWSAEQVTDAAIDLVSQKSEPFFLFLNYFDAHDPHVLMGAPPWFDPKSAQPSDLYDSEIAAIDAQVARLLQSLEGSGQLARTLVVVAADHGEYFGERKLRGHPAAVYQPSTHVPLALRLPGVVPPGRTGRRTGLHEVFRMVEDVVGRNSLDWLREADLTPRILTEAWARPDYGRTLPADGRPSTTVVFAGSLKLIHRLSGRNELFDLEADPAEAIDLIDSGDPRLLALKAEMLREVDLRVARPPGPAQPLSEDAKERLRALGYLK